MDLLGYLIGLRSSLSHDDQIRCMGWGLLLLWTLSITYMTRDFWFPSAFGLPPLSERMQVPQSPERKSYGRKRLSMTGRDLRLLTNEKQKMCEAFARAAKERKSSALRKKSGISVIDGDNSQKNIRSSLDQQAF
uniref:Uncharacterized protein n=1 Tax=Heterorhabditis bacteriophora TaxID=37862 RepID=A0A1I7XUW4_HETBA